MAEHRRRGFDAWWIYLTLLVGLIPIVVPSGPARLAFVDGVIILGLGAFAIRIMTRKEPVRIPFLAPVLIISVGSLVAVINAESASAAFLTMAQDAYLFLWFIMLVHLLEERDLTRLQWTWVVVGNVIALWGIILLVTQLHVPLVDIIKPSGKRAYGTFYDPNMYAGYLVMSLFFVLSLGRRIAWPARWGSLGLLATAILATKSNGGLLSLMAGLAVWFTMRARVRQTPATSIFAGSLLIVALGLGAVWLNVGLGVGAAQLGNLQRESFLARSDHSAAGRLTIWKNLQSTYARSPLGIGPGNSRYLTLSIEDRLRPNSLQAKEAHNDYLAYAIERGPLGLIGLLSLLGSAFAKLFSAARRRDEDDATWEMLQPLVPAAAGALAASVVHALTIEVLHFRHFWMLLAVICATATLAHRGRARSRGPARTASMWSRGEAAA